MQDAFRPEHMRQEAECARVDFLCPFLKQDLRDGKMMTMTIYPTTAGFFALPTIGRIKIVLKVLLNPYFKTIFF